MEKKPRAKKLKTNDLIIQGLIDATKNTLALVNQLQQNEMRILKDQEWLLENVIAAEKDNASLKEEVKELKNVLDAVLAKLHLEVKKVVKEKETKGLVLHDDYTDRCNKCHVIVNRKDKSCHHCGYIKK